MGKPGALTFVVAVLAILMVLFVTHTETARTTVGGVSGAVITVLADRPATETFMDDTIHITRHFGVTSRFGSKNLMPCIFLDFRLTYQALDGSVSFR